MGNYDLTLHHLGLAVKESSAAVHFLRATGYDISPPIFDPQQNVNLIMCHRACSLDVEIIWPMTNLLLRGERQGLVYHMAFTVKDAARELQKMVADGLKPACIAPPKPAVLFGGAPVSFHIVPGMGLIELIETGRG